jgi:acetyl-CoA acetyltransferase
MSTATAVIGVGTTAFGRLPEYNADQLGGWALTEALADAGLDGGDIDGLIVNRVSSYEAIAAQYGIQPSWVAQMPVQGRMSGASITLAALAINAGLCKRVALLYGNNGRSAGATYGGEGGGYGSARDLLLDYAMVSPGAFYALMLQRYMHTYGVTSEQLAAVSMTFRKHASLNPNAVMRDLVTLEDYLDSRWVVEPMHLLDYCLINDGGVALIMTSAEEAATLTDTPVHLLGYGQQGQLVDSDLPPEDFWHGAISAVGERARTMAGRTREDMDALMIYDNFSPNVLFSLEGLGYCEPGEAGDYIQDGRMAIGGRRPVNTSGGHLSESYMQGWALNAEAIRQLRGQCGERQVAGATTIQYVCASPVCSSLVYSTEMS